MTPEVLQELGESRTVAQSRVNGRVFAAVTVLFLLLAVAAVLAKREFNFVVGDGRGYYVYLPSLIVDGDLDFRNEMRAHWGPGFTPALLQDTTARGLVRNRYPVGMALTLLPSFLLAHAASSALHAATGSPRFAADGYTLFYQTAALLTVILLGLFTMILLQRWLSRFMGLPERIAVAAVLLFWVGSPYAYYYFREPLMVHVASTFWVTATLVLAGRAANRDAPVGVWVGPALLSCFAMAVVTRPTNGFLALPVAWCVARNGSALLPLSWRYLVAAVPLLVQLAVWRALFGAWLPYTYGNERFTWGSPALVETLWSPRHGLFVWSPLLLIAALGLGAGWRLLDAPRRGLALGLVAGSAALWYVNSSWETWWFGDAFGGRAFLELAPLFVLGLALALARLARARPAVRRVGHGLIGVSVAYSYALMLLYITNRISRSEALF